MFQTQQEILSLARARVQRLINELERDRAELNAPEHSEGRARALRAIEAAKATEATITRAMSHP